VAGHANTFWSSERYWIASMMRAATIFRRIEFRGVCGQSFDRDAACGGCHVLRDQLGVMNRSTVQMIIIGWRVRRIVRWANNVARGKDDRRKTSSLAQFVEGGTIGTAKKCKVGVIQEMRSGWKS
jgi:hypothetical protein